MPYVSEIITTVPADYKTPLQKTAYKALTELNMPFMRVDTEELITMDDCTAVNKKLDVKMVKTLFLCDRKQANFHLFITAGDKPFRTKDFSSALGVSRLSFAPAEHMEKMLGTKVGAATVFSVLLSSAKNVQLVFHKDVLLQQWYACSDGTTTGYMKIKTDHVVNCLLPHAGRTLTTVTV